ncbi:apoptosis-associated speck-like protein containing a CARD [Acanthochromis polyacanthus]|uniref:apoptosis-associated speck-like protein containing a CARD n=1 Tax=Acanthochromis polyacanthus TaxID=80966 RepID=UPI000B9088AB|nr:apoptosis-associated speck-like protein containing a CARD [Acanthochromis polyacanthus]
MAGQSVRSVLMNALQNLAQDDLKRFIQELWVRELEGQPRVPRSKVEGKDYMEVANVMVSTFTERHAKDVAVEILNSIGCSEEADKLGFEDLR